jgi:predicted CXXCH cytochrome family protein
MRATNQVALCSECHTLANLTTPAAHFNRTSGPLWPGGQYGTLYPAITDTSRRGSCENCHQVHGWADSANPTNHYPKLLVDTEESLCFTCHDANGPAAKDVKTQYAKLRHHPVGDSEQKPGRMVECNSCHNAHKAISGAHNYGTTATAGRNLASNPLKGVSGVAVNFNSLTNFQTVSTNLYTLLSSNPGATYEYQICFKCHSGYAWGAGTPPNGLSPNGSAATPVETDLAREYSPRNKSGHPVVTGLDNYPNSTTVGSPAKRGLQPAQLKAPWNVNVGQQTMLCSDCHNTDAASPAAQGPHGSAYQFMLRGTNAVNWPNVTLANYNTSWCANCHNSYNNVHARSAHRNRVCWACHVVIPHGGKVSRLMADHARMPARYSYNNTLNSSYLTAFTKGSTNGYGEGNCSGCGEHGGGSERW